jgi:uncharacterized protein YecE (DUF72 family)
MTDPRIGTAGWSVPKHHSVNSLPQQTHLIRYSQVFNCAEINSSFYRSHRLSTWAKWADSVPEDFRFSVKAPRAITHEANLACTPVQLQIFFSEARTLARKLGPILFQLPPRSVFNPIIAKGFFTMLRDLHQGFVVLEPRNSSWFTADASQLLEDFQIARAASDPARVPEAAQSGGWSGLIYCRLHGSPRIYYSAYPESYLQTLAATIASHSEKELWCVFDNTAAGAAFPDAQILRRLLYAG